MSEVITPASIRPPEVAGVAPDLVMVSPISTPTQTHENVSKVQPKEPQDFRQQLQTLQSQIEAVLAKVDKAKIDLSVGQTPIQRDKAVVLAWSKGQRLPENLDIRTPDIEREGDGVLLYLAIRYKTSGSSGDENNNDGSTKRVPPMVPNRETASAESSRGSNEDFGYDSDPRGADSNSSVCSGESGDRGERPQPDLAVLEEQVPEPQVQEEQAMELQIKEAPKETVNADAPSQKQPEWQELVIRQRNVQVSDLSDLFVSDKSRLKSHSGPSVVDVVREALDREKTKKSVRWKERLLEDSPGVRRRPGRRQMDHCKVVDLSLATNRQPRTNERSQRPLRRTRSLDIKRAAGNANAEQRSHPLRRTRSYDFDDRDDFAIVLSTNPPAITPKKSRFPAPQVARAVRRLRSKHVKVKENLWFGGKSGHSFNSRCNFKHYDIHDLDENATHYYFYRSRPKPQNAQSPT